MSFGGGAKPANQTTQYQGLQVQTSCYGQPIALIYGRTRTACNLIWYNNFQAIPQNQSSAGGKGGSSGGGGKGGGGQTTFTYTADVILALGEGPITGVPNMWVSQTESTPAAEGLNVFDGAIGQATWSLLLSQFPSQALNYSGIAYVAGGPYQLGNSASLPNNNFEVEGLLFGTAPNGQDADPSLMIVDIATNPGYGAGLPTNRIGTLSNNNETDTIPASGPFTITVSQHLTFQFNLCVVVGTTVFKCVASSPAQGQYSFTSAGVYTFNSADAGKSAIIRYASLAGLSLYQAFTMASGLWVSPAYTTQTAASSMLDDIAAETYSSFVWSSGVLTIIPRGTQVVVNNGFGYTPNTTPVFNITEDDFLQNQGSGSGGSTSNDPVILSRTRPADMNNTIRQDFLDRNNQYAQSTAEFSDQSLIDRFKRRVKASRSTKLFCDANAANTSVQLQMQDEYIRNMYTFTLDQRFGVLDPMDIVTLTESKAGLSQLAVRITEITENDDGTLIFVAEEYPIGAGAAAAFSVNTGSGYVANFNADPGFVNTPLIFEPPVQVNTTTNGLQLWIALSGVSVATWGGCQVWASTDGSSYPKSIGDQVGPARMGVTTANFPVGPDPDTMDPLSIDMTMSNGSLTSGTQLDADQDQTLCVVSSINGVELVSYQQATLTGTNKYNLGTTGGTPGYLGRGRFGTPIVAAPAGSQFARMDDAIFIVPYDKSQIGQTIFLKFPSFNIWNGGQQSTADVPPYSYVIKGPPLPSNVTGFVVKQNGGAVVFSWNPVADFALDGYDILFGVQGGSIVNAEFLTFEGAGTEMTNSSVPPGTWRFYIVAKDIAGQESPVPATFDLQVTNPNPVIIDDLEAPGWTGTLSGLVMTWDRKLVPDSTSAANAVTKAQLFEQYVPTPVTTSTYKSKALDAGVDGSLRVYSLFTFELGRGQSGAISNSFAIDTWLTGAVDPNSFIPWTIGEIDFRFLRGELILTNVAGQVPFVDQVEIIADQTSALVDAGNNVIISAGGTIVPFNRNFHTPPSVIVTPVSATALIGSAESITDTQCKIHVYNTSGTDIGGTVNWVATGD